MASEPPAPAVTDRRAGATGLLPKNIQAWVMVGIALLIVLVIAFSGGGKSAPAAQQSAGLPPGVPRPDELAARIAALQAQQEQLQREALLAQNQPAAETPATGGPTPDEQLAAEARRRQYASLFSSQIAQTYRRKQPQQPPAVPAAAPAAPAGATATPPQEEAEGPLPSATSLLAEQPASTQPSQQAEYSTPRSAGTRPPAAPSRVQGRARPGVKDYALFEGTVLESVLLTRLTSDFSGPTIVMTTSPIYSRNRQRLLIPPGTKVLGHARKVDTFGQTRMAVSFDRLIMPDGYAVDLDRFVGLAGTGETALKDQVNNHYLKIFGASIALGLFGGLSAFGTQNPSFAQAQPTLDTYRQGVAQSFAQSAGRVLERFLNILPTITIREGHRVRVYLTSDLRLPAYDDHAMPPDL